MATYSDAITGAHRTLNDSARTRYPDIVTFEYAQDALREIYTARPDMFVGVGNVPCGDGVAKDGHVEIDAGAVGLYVLDVISVAGGRAVTRGDFETLRRYRPTWRTDPVGPCQHWFPMPTDQMKRPDSKFLIYPPAPEGQELVVQFVSLLVLPTAQADLIQLPDYLLPAIESYIVFRCEMVDDEHVVQQRAQAAYTNFATIIGVDDKAQKTVVLEGRPQ
jgi:hypothetical protein